MSKHLYVHCAAIEPCSPGVFQENAWTNPVYLIQVDSYRWSGSDNTQKTPVIRLYKIIINMKEYKNSNPLGIITNGDKNNCSKGYITITIAIITPDNQIPLSTKVNYKKSALYHWKNEKNYNHIQI